MNKIELTTEETKFIISHLAALESKVANYMTLSRSGSKDMFDLFCYERKMLQSLMERLINGSKG